VAENITTKNTIRVNLLITPRQVHAQTIFLPNNRHMTTPHASISTAVFLPPLNEFTITRTMMLKAISMAE
jgi:hypothetical protein